MFLINQADIRKNEPREKEKCVRKQHYSVYCDFMKTVVLVCSLDTVVFNSVSRMNSHLGDGQPAQAP